MKKLLFSVAILLSFLGWAQSDTLNIDNQEHFIDSLFAHVDMSHVTSGYLLDYQYSLLDPTDFYELDTGQTEVGVPAHSPFSYIAAEALFTKMQVDETQTAHQFAQKLIGDHSDKQNNSTFHIGMAFMQYHRLHTDQNTLQQTLSFSDWKYHDLEERPFSPFEEHYTFIASTAAIESTSRVVSFQLDTDDIATNLNGDDFSIEIDFDDGLGYKTISPDGVYSINYTDFGAKKLQYKLHYNGNTYLSASAMLIKNKVYSSNVSDLISALDGYDNIPDDSLVVNYQGISATAYIEYGCGHDKLVQPLILVNGFDFNNEFDYKYIYGKLNAAELNIPLQSNQMDLVFIDFDEGSGNMYDNSELTKEVIRQVNTLKAENNSFYENVVIGFSMGGVLGRMALREMELDGEDHQTRDFVSYDSPHQGANVPLAMQYLIKDLGGDIEEGVNNSISGINDLYTTLSILTGTYTWQSFINLLTGGNFELFIVSPIGIPLDEDAQEQLGQLAQMALSPAAKQLLIYQAHESNTANHTHNAYQADEHIDFINHLESIGYPQNCKKTAISNGNANGDKTKNINPADKLFLIKIDKDINGIDANFDLWGEALPYTSSSFEKFYHARAFGHKKLWDFWGWSSTITITMYNRYAHVKNSQPFDTAPGGLFIMEGDEFSVDSLNANFIKAGFTIDAPTSFKNKFNFIPMVSSLGLNEMDNANYSFGSTDISSSGTGESPFDIISTFEDYDLFSSQYNQMHVDFSSEHTAKINSAVLPTNVNYPSPATPYLAQKLNFGKGETTVTRTYIYPFPVLNNGTLCVNCDDRIGFSDISTNEQAIDNSHFNVETSLGCDYEGQIMEIQDGGRIEIGDGNNRTGNFIIRKWSTVRAKTGSTIMVRKGSKLIVDDGAKLIIEPGVDIILEDDSSVMEFHGKEALEITANTTFSFSGSGNLYFDKDWDPDYPMSVVLGENAKIDLEGSGDNDLVLKAGKNFAIGGNHTNEFKIWHGKVQIEAGRNISVSTPIDWRYNKFECSSPWEKYKSIVLWGEENMIRHCKFIRGGEGANEAAIQAHLMDEPLKVFFCDFNDCDTGIRVKGERMSVFGCDFDNGNMAIHATTMEGFSFIKETDINNVTTGITFAGQAGSELLIKESNISNGEVGIGVNDTKLNLECSEIDNMLYEGVIVADADLILNSSGKNTISNCNYGISCYNASNLFISNGYNTFSGNYYDIEGNFVNYTDLSTDFQYVYTGQTGPKAIPNHYSLNMANNIVNNDFIAIANANASSTDGTNLPVRPINYQDLPTIPSCDPHGSGLIGHLAELNFTEPQIGFIKSVTSTHFVDENMYHAGVEATSYMTYRDTEGQNTTAVNLLADILNHLPENMSRDDKIVADFLYQKMLEAVAYVYTEEEVERNLGIPNAIINETLNLATEVIDNKLANLNGAIGEEAELISDLLMDKAQLFRTAGHFDYAQLILDQSSNWQTIQTLSRADYWSCIVDAEEDLVLGNITFQQFREASNLCAQNNNARMAGRQRPNNKNFLENFVNYSDFLLNPSVSSSLIRISVLNQDYNSELQFKVVDVLGKVIEVNNLNGLEHRWDVSDWKKGVYFIEISKDNKQLETLKILVI
jgi:hypothetical protein